MSVVHLVPMVLGETQVALVLLDLLVLLVILAGRESALKEAKEKMDSLEVEDPKVTRHIEFINQTMSGLTKSSHHKVHLVAALEILILMLKFPFLRALEEFSSTKAETSHHSCSPQDEL